MSIPCFRLALTLVPPAEFPINGYDRPRWVVPPLAPHIPKSTRRQHPLDATLPKSEAPIAPPPPPPCAQSQRAAQECEELLGSVSVDGVTFAPWLDEGGPARAGGQIELRPWDSFDHTKKLRNRSGKSDYSWDVRYEDCTSRQHCKETDVFETHCDHLKINMASILQPRRGSSGLACVVLPGNASEHVFTPLARHVTILVLIACLFAVPLYSDMESAACDEVLLDYRLRLNAASLGLVQRVTAAIVRPGLRIRRLVLPWVLSITAVAVLTTGELSVTAILLNLLAVTFLLEERARFPNPHRAPAPHPNPPTPRLSRPSAVGRHARADAPVAALEAARRASLR